MKKWHFPLTLVATVAIAMAAGPVMAGPENAPNGPIAELLERVGNLEEAVESLVEWVNTLDARVTDLAMPEGSIIMWSGEIDENGHPVVDETPDPDWWLCDGANGTPDLTDRFVLGAGDSYKVGVTGGSSEQTLTVENLPAHGHSFSETTSTDGDHRHRLQQFEIDVDSDVTLTSADFWTSLGAKAAVTDVDVDSASSLRWRTEMVFWPPPPRMVTLWWPAEHIEASGSHSHTVSGTTNEVGDGESFDIMPPYYALAFIMYMPE